MIRKIGGFLEDHIEKIVLIIVGILCTWLLITRVIFSPNVVSYESEGKTINVSPSDIDNLVFKDARSLLQQKRGTTYSTTEKYKSKVSDFLALLEMPVSNIDITLSMPNPKNIQAKSTNKDGNYIIPDGIIGYVTDVAVEYIRAAAYIPTSTITEENLYGQDTSEPNNLDFVTVEAKYDISGLCDSFYEIFVDDVDKELEDINLAKPIFATTNLQRRELQSNGFWSEWQYVPLPKISPYGYLFNIIEDVKSLPAGGLELRKLQLDDIQIQMELLQPQSYQIASAKEEWYPPLIHRQFLDAQAKEDRQEKREAREEENNERQERSNRRNTRSGSGIYSPGTQGGAYGAGQTRGRDRRGSRTTPYDSTTTDRSRTRSRSDRTNESDYYPLASDGSGLTTLTDSPMDEVIDEFDKIMLTPDTDLNKMSELLVFWAHDDTVEPKKSYQYRIRLGVLNPIAGKEKNDLILWSEFSDITETVEIPGMMYFFAKSIKEAAKTINVTVCKYILGYWYSEDFSVDRGEVIGDIIETEIEEESESRTRIASERLTYITTSTTDEFVEPEMINYNTGAVMLDVAIVDDWEGERTLDSRRYYDMLYSFDGINIEHMPVNSKNWPQEMILANSYVSRQLKEAKEKEPFKEFGTSRLQQRLRLRQDREYENPDEYYMMLDEQAARGARY